MPLTHASLLVSHLPASTTFFLQALHPLGYRFRGETPGTIGFGADRSDFFIHQSQSRGPEIYYTTDPFHIFGSSSSPLINSQDSQNTSTGHVAFSAPTRAAVSSFYNSALRAGGRSYLPPGENDRPAKCFSASVEDLDGNVIECVWNCHSCDNDTHAEHTEDIDDAEDIVRDVDDHVPGNAGQSLVNAAAVLSSLQRSFTDGMTLPVRSGNDRSGLDISNSTIAGTLLGAAAGAAAVYALCQQAIATPATTSHNDSGDEPIAMPVTTARRSSRRIQWQEPTLDNRAMALSGPSYSNAPPNYSAPPILDTPPQTGGHSTIKIVSRPSSTAAESTFSTKSRKTKVRAIEGPSSSRHEKYNYSEKDDAEDDRKSYATRTSYKSAKEDLLPTPTPPRSEVTVRSKKSSKSSDKSKKSDARGSLSGTHRPRSSRNSRSEANYEYAPEIYTEYPKTTRSSRSVASAKSTSKYSVHSRKSKASEGKWSLPPLGDETDDDLCSLAPSDSISNVGSGRSRRSSTLEKARSEYARRYDDYDDKSDKFYARKHSSEPGHESTIKYKYRSKSLERSNKANDKSVRRSAMRGYGTILE